MSGLTVTGFERKRLAEIQTDIETRLKTAFGENIDLTAQSGFGQFVGIMAEVIADQWESQENVYNAMYPSTAQGAQLSNVVMLNGLARLAAIRSTVDITFGGTDGVTVPIGMQVATADTGIIFETTAAGVITGGTVVLAAQSVDAGAYEATAGTLTAIETPLYGVLTATNVSDATVGRFEETDAELRARREQSVSLPGQSHADALAAQLLDTTNVIDATVFSNGADATVDGVPAHRFRCVVNGGADADIAAVIWANTPQAILSFGDESVNVTDYQGDLQEVQFTRADAVDIYFTLNLTVNPVTYSVGSEDDIKQAVVDYGFDNFKISDNVLRNRFVVPVMETEGVEDVDVRVGLTPSPTGTSNITISSTEYSNYAVAWVVINYV